MAAIILSSAYLPPIEYFVSMLRSESVMIENRESYTRQTYRNRCIIAGPNGRQVLTVPVIQSSRGRGGIERIRADDSKRWQSIHWRSLEAAYNKSPYFHYYREEFMPYYLSKQPWLFVLNHELLLLCMKLAGINVTIGFTDHFQRKYADADDRRAAIHQKGRGKGMDYPRYPQVFESKLGFLPNLSIVDLLFNRGPDAKDYLESVRADGDLY
jgi:hypothetical protein